MRGAGPSGAQAPYGDSVDLLRVGIDGRAFSSPAPGIRRYVEGLVPALLALGEPLEILALGGRHSSVFPPGMGHIEEPPHPPTNAGWTLVGLPRAAQRGRVDLIHAPAYTAPWWAPVPVVVTIHDVSYERCPQWYPYRRDWMRRAFYRKSAHAASHILTVSQFSASEIRAAYGIGTDRITVTPLGVDRGFAPAAPTTRLELPANVAPPYVLHVGDLHERRNVLMLMEALLHARRCPGPASKLSLVTIGADRGVLDAVRAVAALGDAAAAFVHMDSVTEEQLRRLYRGAVALVYPSLYEGFGLPLIEAMAIGTPVIASDAASIPEVVGNAGMLLDPRDRDAWADAMVAMVAQPETRHRLRAAGIARAATFTWERTARLTWEVYRRVA